MADSTTRTGGWTTRRYLSLLGTIAIWVIVAVDAWFLWPATLGGDTSIVIVSGQSMEPTYFSGDLVIARDMEPTVGDVIVYAPEGFGGSQIVHRIIGGNADDGWQMQGDNNDFVDPFTPTAEEVKGVVLVHYPSFGRITSLILNPIVWAFVLLAALVLLVWYSDDCDDEDEDEDARAATQDPVPDIEPERSDLATRAAAVFAALAAVVGIGISPASATQLDVTAGNQVYGAALAKCAELTLAAAPTTQVAGNNWTGITVDGFAAACDGLDVTVELIRSNGTTQATASGTVSGTSGSFATAGNYGVNQVAHAVVTINGWPFIASWSASVAPYSCVPTDAAGNVLTGPGDTCAVTALTIDSQWGQGANANYSVTSSSGFYRVTFDFSQAPFPGWTPQGVDGNGSLAPGASCSTLPVITIAGPSWSQFQGPSYQYYVGIRRNQNAGIC